jgi:hypothetical protein
MGAQVVMVDTGHIVVLVVMETFVVTAATDSTAIATQNLSM